MSKAHEIVAKVCNEHKNSDLRADNRAVCAAFDEALVAKDEALATQALRLESVEASLVLTRDNLYAERANGAAMRKALAHVRTQAWSAQLGNPTDLNAIANTADAVLESPSPGADLLERHAEELAAARKFADCWAKAESALSDMGMERDALRQRAEAAEAKLAEVRRVTVEDGKFGEVVEALFYGPLREVEAALRAVAQRAEAAEAELEELKADMGAGCYENGCMCDKVAALTKERDEATARANSAEEGQ